MPSLISQNLQRARQKTNSACAASGRNPSAVKILAATKGRPVEKIRAAVDAGISLCGENYVQEAEHKIAEIGKAVEWHFVGHLQSNKAKKAVQLFSCIQTVDSLKLARKINDASEKPFPVFVGVNIAEEETKFGVKPSELSPFFSQLKEFPNLEVMGLFCMAPFLPRGQTRPFFQKMSVLAQQLSLRELSMGMSNDFGIAIEEGSTMVRLGTALFGKRRG